MHRKTLWKNVKDGNVFKCPGQDQRFWKPEDIFEIECPNCGRSKEFFKDEPQLKCRKCGYKIVNPNLDLGCAKWCKYADRCIPAIAGKETGIVQDKLTGEKKKGFGETAVNKTTVRNIVKIDEDKCDGCGECVSACAEGAIKLINGKAKLISETYCDGIGACIGHCPQDAITVEQKECAEFDQKAVEKHLESQKNTLSPTAEKGSVCPGLAAKQFGKKDSAAGDVSSQLSHWPIQLKLVSANAPFLKNADLLIAADCVPFAMGDFHSGLLKNHSIVIGCPKLDDVSFYIEKITQILNANNLNSLTVVHMEVPCCFGLTRIVQQAIANSGKALRFEDITISLDGKIKKTELIEAV